MFEITTRPDGSTKATYTQAALAHIDRDSLEYAVTAYGFLVPRNTTWSGPQFASAMTGYSAHLRTQWLATLLQGIKGK